MAVSFYQRESLNLGFPYLLCCAPVSSNISEMAGWTEFDESFTPRVKTPIDFKYDVRIEV